MSKDYFLQLGDYFIVGRDYISRSSGLCEACGAETAYTYSEIINDQLAKQWRLSRERRQQISARESMYCMFCGSSYRLRKLAGAITSISSDMKREKQRAPSLKQAIDRGTLEGISVAEINSCGVLHDILKDITGLSYSEFQSADRGIPHQDIMDLTYKDNVFDIVLTSDTLEHVPDYRRALRQIYRVLKPGGCHIFTIPLLMDRKTATRAQVAEKGEVRLLGEASYHGAGQPDYLVVTEFGYDFITDMEAEGFEVTVQYINLDDIYEPSYVFVARKIKENDKRDLKHTVVADEASRPAAQKIVKKLLPRLQYNFITENSQNDAQWQLARLSYLANKLTLTAKHISNIEAINESYADEIMKLRERISYLEKRTVKGLVDEGLKKITKRTKAH